MAKAPSPRKLTNFIVERNSELEEQIRTNKSSTLKGLHSRAQKLTVDAQNKIHSIVKAWENRINRGTARSVARNAFVQQQVAEAEKLRGQLLKEKNPQKRTALEREIASAISRFRATDQTIMVPALLATYLDRPSELVSPLFFTLEEILKHNIGATLKEYGKAGGMAAITSFPILGKILSISMKLDELARAASTKRKTADDYLAFLEAYIFALEQWCNTADQAIVELNK